MAAADIATKTCGKCLEIKAVSQFYSHKKHKDGLRSECKECCKANAHGWNRKNPGRVLARVKKYTEENRDRRLAYWRAHSRKHATKKKAYRIARYRANPAPALAATKLWAKANPEKRSVITRRCAHKRRALILGGGGSFSRAEIEDLFKKQRGKCAACSTSIKGRYHMDHIIALTNGGSNWISNIQLLCRSCNCSKHAMHPIDFMQSRGFLL